MNTQEVVQKLRFYVDARKSIQNDRHLSDAGKERARKNLEESISLFRGQAHQVLNQAWTDARRTYEKVENLRAQAEILEGTRWNYQALNYEKDAVKARLAGFRSVQEVAHYVEGVLSSANKERSRALCELAPEQLRKKFPGLEGEHISRELGRRLNSLLETPELAKVREIESEGGSQVLQLVAATEEVYNFFKEPGFFSSGNEFSRLLENVNIQRTYQPENMNAFQVTTITFTEQAPAGVVA